MSAEGPAWGSDWSVGLRVWVERAGRAVLGKGRLELLEGIGRHGSISAAARQLGMSYRRAWLLVQDSNEAAGTPLVEAVAGGPNGKRLTDLTNGNGSSNIVIVWDHGRTPGCANSTIAAPRGPWQPFTDSNDTTHYPAQRHDGVFNVLFCDAHVAALTQSELQDSLFYATGP